MKCNQNMNNLCGLLAVYAWYNQIATENIPGETLRGNADLFFMESSNLCPTVCSLSWSWLAVPKRENVVKGGI